MDKTFATNEMKLMSRHDIEACGWVVPSFKQLAKNMDKRLKKVRGEFSDDENFLTRHNYISNSNCHSV